MSRTWVLSDIHGNGFLFDAILEKIGSNDTVYFLGDAIDRGYDGWRILKHILQDPRFVYLMGNHEDMMLEFFRKNKNRNTWLEKIHWSAWGSNGGLPTLEAAMKDPDFDQVIEDLNDILILTAGYTNKTGDRIHMSHSGMGPWNSRHTKFEKNDILWDRTHFFWGAEELSSEEIVVHGHTPIPHIINQIDMTYIQEDIDAGALWYAGGQKVCIDCGTAWTGVITLMDLDTFEEEVFVEEHMYGEADI